MKRILIIALLGLCVASGCCTSSTVPAPTEPTPAETGIFIVRGRGTLAGEQWVTDTEIVGARYNGIDANFHYDAPHFDAYISEAPYATRWSDGTVTYSTVPYAGVDYGSSPVMTSEFNSNYLLNVTNSIGDELDDEDPWMIGTETGGHTPSDYALNDSGTEYTLNSATGTNTNTAVNTVQTDPADTTDILEDLEDAVNDIVSNDGVPII
ncbi:MAG: hypothetical protein LBT09_04925 [Planctomycetaceae bacterium]|jgi:hypothetical protein|nr:hypothetical protein [Planctomycetaceae bacterium]